MANALQSGSRALRATRTIHKMANARLLPLLTPPSVSYLTRPIAARCSYPSQPRRCLSTSSSPSSSPPDSERGALATAFTASTVRYVEDDLELRSIINRDPQKLVVVDWFATWCGPCQAIAPLYEQLSVENKNVVFIGADIEEMPDASAQAGVQAVPCFHFIKGNELVAVLTGADEVKLRELVKQWG